jgi:hypothetical protein
MVAPVDGTATVVSSLKDWIRQPFDAQMSLKGWLLFTGLIIVAVILWTMVLRDLKGEMLS